MSARIASWIALAFVVGAILPAVGVIAGAAAFGYWVATSGQRLETLASGDLLDEINAEARQHQRRRKQKRLR